MSEEEEHHYHHPSPPIDDRDFKALVRELRQYAPFYTPDWNASNDEDPGVALVKIFSHIMSYVVDRLNKVPLRYYIEFLNMLGVRLSPGLPAKANVTFILTEGVKHDVLVASGTRLLAAATEKHKDLTFETIENTLLTRAKLVEIFSSVNSTFSDSIYRHTHNLLAKQPFSPFMGNNIQTHLLYLGHPNLFNIRKNSKIVIDFYCSNPVALATALETAKWEYNWKIDPDTGNEVSSNLYANLLGLSSRVTTTPSMISTATSRSKADPKKVTLTLSFAKRGPIKFDKNAYESIDVVELTLDAKADPSPVITLKSSSDPMGITFKMTSKNHLGEFIESVILTNSEKSSSSSDETKRRLRVKEGDVLTAVYAALSSIASVINAMHRPEIEERDLVDMKSRWIRCSISPEKFAPSRNSIESITMQQIKVHTESELDKAYKPDTLFYNDVPLKNVGTFKEPILPFGNKPIMLDAFYLASEDVFSKKGASVTVSFVCFYNNKLIIKNDLVISWEYWNGRMWSNIHYSFNEEEILDSDGLHWKQWIDFVCPEDIERVQVNGNESYWIRARIVLGDYGKEILMADPGTPPLNYRVSSIDIHAPKIYNLVLSYQMPPQDVRQCITYNNLEYNRDLIKADGVFIRPFRSFIGQEDNAGPGIFFGFNEKLEKGPINLYLSLEEREVVNEEKEPSIKYYYYSSSGWKRLDSLDGTRDLSRSGYVKFLVPPDFITHSVFGKRLYWIKAIDTKKRFISNIGKENNQLPYFKAVYLNTIPCANIVRVDQEVLGSSNSEKNQYFRFSKAPVVSSNAADTKVWVNETRFITEDERDALREKKQIYEVKDNTGKAIEIWTLWQEVQDIYTSSPNDRNFELDRASGELKFGDGFYGKIPSQGLDNIRTSYIAGEGGIAGNVQTDEINSVKSPLPFVDSVSNPEAAWGGMDIESLNNNNVLQRGPQIIKHRGQAVTYEDFEWLIREEFPSIAKVKCFPTTWTKGKFKSGHVLVVIAPLSSEEKPMPSFELLDQVRQYLQQMSSNVVVATRQLKVIRPLFTQISVRADIYVKSFDQAPIAERGAQEALKRFLHPLFGGPAGTGWEFGKLICISDIYSLLESIQEIDHVENLSVDIELDSASEERSHCKKCLITSNDIEEIGADFGLPPYLLIYNGEHDLTFRLSMAEER